MNRIELINRLVAERGYERYLEIGCAENRTFDRITAKTRVGVDPVRGGTVRSTSDEFFAGSQDRFDLIFIDGLHHREQVLRDIRNSLCRLSANGVIILHDCLPSTREEQSRRIPKGAWTGDVWKAMVDIRQQPDCDTAVLDADHGLGIVLPRRNTDPIRPPGNLTWERYVSQRHELLRILAPSELTSFIDPPSIARRIQSRRFCHLVLTRFNVGMTDSDWLSHRVRLFERFTQPSMAGQSCRRFQWLIACDDRTPDPWRSRLKAIDSENVLTLWRQQAPDWPELLRQFVSHECTHVATTRIDNDDAVARDYIERVQINIELGTQSRFLNMPLGLVWSRGRVAVQQHRSNHFLSFCEPITDARTVYCQQHIDASRAAPVSQVHTLEPAWVRVCHERNISNRAPELPDQYWIDEAVMHPEFAIDYDRPV